MNNIIRWIKMKSIIKVLFDNLLIACGLFFSCYLTLGFAGLPLPGVYPTIRTGVFALIFYNILIIGIILHYGGKKNGNS